MTAFPFDDLTYIDGVWRIVQGQHPGTDFYNPIGFGLFHIGSAWWQILGPHRYVLPLTSATFSALITFCASIICARRICFSAPYYLLICGVIAFEASAPSVYGWSFFTISMAAFYNRLTAAALTILFIQWFGECRRFQERNNISELVISATLLNVLFLVKISSLAIALAIIGVSIVFRPQAARLSVKSGAMVCIFFVFMLIGDFVVTGIDLQSILRDYREAAAVRSSLVSSDGIWRVLQSGNAVVCALLLICYARKPPAIPLANMATVIATYVIVQLGQNVSNTQPATIFLAPACAFVLLSWRQRLALCQPGPQQGLGDNRTKSSMAWIPVAICLIVLVPEALASLFGAVLVGAVAFGLTTPIIVSSGHGLGLPVLGGFGDAERGIDFAVKINRGIEALRDMGVAQKAIATIDYANPFPSLLGTPSPKGVPVVWALGYMEQPSILLETERLFGDACIVMVALRPTQVVEGSAELLAAAAKPLLSTDFAVARQDEYWTIYRRENGCS